MLAETYKKALQVKAAIAHPRIMGIIRECGGKMYMRTRKWSEATSDFFEAFKYYDEAGDPRRVLCLKYLVLAKMLTGSAINPFDSPETAVYRDHPQIQVMTTLVQLYQQNDVKRFEQVLQGM